MITIYSVLRALRKSGHIEVGDIGWAACWGWSIEAAVAAMQYATGQPFGLVANYFGQNANEATMYNWSATLSVWRVSGTHPHPIMFGMWMTAFALLAFGYLGQRKGIAASVFRSLILPVTAWVLFISLTRGTLTYFLLAVLAYSYLRALRRNGGLLFWYVGAAAVGLVAAYLWFTPDIFGQLGSSSALAARFGQAADDLRWELISQGLHLLNGDPTRWFVGVGTNAMFPAALQMNLYTGLVWGWLDLSNTTVGIESMYLKLLVENGFLVFFLFVALHIHTLRLAVKNAAGYGGGRLDAAIAAIVVGWIVAFNVYLLSISPFHAPILALVLAFADGDRR